MRRVPTFFPRGVTWRLPISSLSLAEEAFAKTECLILGDNCGRYPPEGDALGAVAWPPRLKAIFFAGEFNNSLDHTSFPASMQEMHLMWGFMQPIDRVVWPPSLRRLQFGKNFNHPIHDVRWPASVQHLTFGAHFNQPVDQVSWPPSLKKLDFGHYFRHFMRFRSKAAWPPSLKQVSLFMYGRTDRADKVLYPPNEDDEDLDEDIFVLDDEGIFVLR